MSSILRYYDLLSDIEKQRRVVQSLYDNMSRVPAQVVAAVDINNIANKIYRFNFPEVNLLQRNIQSVSLKELTKLDADMFLMSPPCQPFTRVGLKGDKTDPRTASFLYLLDTLPRLTKKPGYILVENVKGFESSETRGQLVDVLQNCNYKFKEFLISPTHVGIPNQRLRYFLLAKLHPLQFGDTFLVDGNHSLLSHKIVFNSHHGDQERDCSGLEGNRERKNDRVRGLGQGEAQCCRTDQNMTEDYPGQSRHGQGSICQTAGQTEAGDRSSSSRGCAISVQCSEQTKVGHENLDIHARTGQTVKPEEGCGMPQNCPELGELPGSSGRPVAGPRGLQGQFSGNDSELVDRTGQPGEKDGNTEFTEGPGQTGKPKACALPTNSLDSARIESVAGPEHSPVQRSGALQSMCEPSDGIPDACIEDGEIPSTNGNSGVPDGSLDACMGDGEIRSTNGGAGVPLRNIGGFLEMLAEADAEEYLVPDKLLLRFGRVMDIVQGDDGDKTCCFTKAYGHYVEGTGSFLQTNKAISLSWAFEEGLEGAQSLARLRQLRLRYFTPREIANFHCFPKEFSFPADVSRKQQYRVLGNSLNAYVVSQLLDYLME